MARTQNEIAASIKGTLANINPTIDMVVGPVWDFLLSPMPFEINSVETEVDNALIFYSANFPSVATTTQLLSFATNFGLAPDTGASATATIVFYRYSAPQAGQTYVVPVGTLVSTVDGTLVYQTTNSVTMYGDYAATYFNPATNKYEVTLQVQATGPGTVYNVPVGRITRLMTQSTGFDGIDQRMQALGGAEPEDPTNLATRIISKFKGLDISSVSGITRMMQEVEPSAVADIHIIRPTDRLEFRRPTTGPALDICVSGQTLQSFNEEYLAIGGEYHIVMTTSTAISVSSITVNSTVLDSTAWSFVKDTSAEYQLSTRAGNTIEFSNPLNANDIVAIVGTKNYLLDQLQAMTTGAGALFETDELVRSFVPLPIVVGVQLRVVNTVDYDASSTQQTLSTIVQSLIETPTVQSVLDPAVFSDQILQAIPEAVTVDIFEFRRQFTSIQQVEVITPLKNQIPVFAATASTLIVGT